MTELSKNAELQQSCITDVICCDSFKENIHNFGWFKLEISNKEEYIMPHILGTNYRINYCPSCGKECRSIVLSSDFYHSI